MVTATPNGMRSIARSTNPFTVSPHMSADFEGFDEALVEVFLKNLRSWRSGRPFSGVVDHQLGYVPSA